MNTDGALDFDILFNTDKANAGLDETKKRIAGLSQAAVNEGKKMDGVFNRMGDMATELIGPVSALTAAYKFQQLAQQALKFENAFGMAMREVQTISKAVQDDFEGMSQKLVDMAANGPDDAVKLAKALYQISSAGFDGAEGLKLLDIAAKAAVAGVTDTRTAADGLTTVLNAFGLSVDNAGKVAGVMFKTVERGKTTFSELASTIAQVAPLAASNNIEFEQIFAALQTITKQGTPTAQAMTQIRSSIVNMNNALGDGWAQTMTYQEGLNKIAEKAGGSATELKKLIPDVEGMSAVLALTGQKAKGAAEDLNETAKAAGAMETAYGRMMLEADNRWAAVHNKWTRQVRELGKALKEESGNLANFTDALLSNSADVDAKFNVRGISDRIKAMQEMTGGGFYNGIKNYLLAPFIPDAGVQQGYDKFVNQIVQQAKKGLSEQQISLGDILGIKDKDEQLIKLNEFLVSMKAAEQDLGNTQLVNEQQQNAALKIRSQLWGEVEARAKEAIKAIEGAGTGGGGEAKGRTLKTMLDEVKAQQDSLGTGTLNEDITALARISALQQEVLVYYNKIREARKVEPVAAIKPLSGEESLGGVQSITKEQSKQEFQGDKLLKQSKARTAEAQKQADAIKEQNDAYTYQTAFFEELTNKLGDAGELLGAMSYAVGEFDSTLGQSVGKMADIANNAANMVASYASGNMVGAIASGIGVIGNVIGLTKSDKEDQTINALERINNLLKQQSAILSNMPGGGNYFALAAKQYRDYGLAIDEINGKLRGALTEAEKIKKDQIWIAEKPMELGPGASEYDRQFYKAELAQWDAAKKDFLANRETLSWTPEQFIEAYANGSLKLDQQQIDWVEEMTATQKARAELLQETFRESLGFDAGTVSDAILKGIEDGLKFGENGLGDFAETFGDLMKKALMQSVINAMNLDITSTFLPEYQKAMSDLTLTDEERANLESVYRSLVEKGQADMNNIKSITDRYGAPSASASSPITGIAASMTEETGSLVAGQFMAMRVDLKSVDSGVKGLQQIVVNQTAILDASLFQLIGIKKNTDQLSQLGPIKASVDETNRILKEKL
ncbi:MAG TPA: phage tail tape measure protein [Prolixibacteraceae bacterium]|nr:phage tail tape measure protein [Prolixibacteraceae bacterium]